VQDAIDLPDGLLVLVKHKKLIPLTFVAVFVLSCGIFPLLPDIDMVTARRPPRVGMGD